MHVPGLGKLTLQLLTDHYAFCRLPATAPLPEWALTGTFNSLTRTADELSIVCLEALVPADVPASLGWRALQVLGPLDFSLTGIAAALTAPLAAAQISVSVIATFDTDYLFVRDETVASAIQALRTAGFSFV